MKTVYRFYVASDVEGMNLNTSIMLNMNRLYAWTDKKELAEEFMLIRNLKVLKMIKSKMTKEEIVDYGNKNRTKELDNYIYLHKENKYSNQPWERINIVSTWEEKESVEMIRDDGINMSEVEASYEFLEDEYIEKLDVLGYTKLHQLYFTEQDDYSIPDFMFDEYELLLSVAGITIRYE